MIEITDELLNKYIEGELDAKTVREINDLMKDSEELKIRFNVLIKVHEELKKIEMKETKPDFTSVLMSKIIKPVKSRKSDRAFILSISGVFVIFCLAILGIAIYYSVISLGQTGQTHSLTQNVFSYTETFIGVIRNYFSQGSVSLLGLIMSFIIIISGYFFFENKKRFDAHHGWSILE